MPERVWVPKPYKSRNSLDGMGTFTILVVLIIQTALIAWVIMTTNALVFSAWEVEAPGLGFWNSVLLTLLLYVFVFLKPSGLK